MVRFIFANRSGQSLSPQELKIVVGKKANAPQKCRGSCCINGRISNGSLTKQEKIKEIQMKEELIELFKQE